MIFEDAFWAGLSVLFVIIYVTIRFKSLFLALFCVIIIGFSFGLAATITTGILKVIFVTKINYLVLFITLLMGINNFLIFHDTWR